MSCQPRPIRKTGTGRPASGCRAATVWRIGKDAGLAVEGVVVDGPGAAGVPVEVARKHPDLVEILDPDHRAVVEALVGAVASALRLDSPPKAVADARHVTPDLAEAAHGLIEPRRWGQTRVGDRLPFVPGVRVAGEGAVVVEDEDGAFRVVDVIDVDPDHRAALEALVSRADAPLSG